MAGKRSIIAPSTPDQINMVRRLCWDYRDYLLSQDPQTRRIVETVLYPAEKYRYLMQNLETDGAPPLGAIRLALREGAPVGCGMVHALEPGVAEIKRVYVTGEARGTGAGLALMLSLIAHCRDAGFDFIRMDTLRVLSAAARLYLSMGFVRRASYCDLPPDVQRHLLFFEMRL